MNFRSIISVLVVFAACSLPCQAADPPPSMRKVLFFDLWKLDAWSNLELRQGEPEWVRACDYRDPSAESRGVG